MFTHVSPRCDAVCATHEKSLLGCVFLQKMSACRIKLLFPQCVMQKSSVRYSWAQTSKVALCVKDIPVEVQKCCCAKNGKKVE